MTASENRGSGKRLVTLLLLVLGVAVLQACTTPQAIEDELSATWRGAKVFVPSGDPGSGVLVYPRNTSSWADAVAREGLTPATKIPAVIHLHGCDGLSSADQRLGAFYARQGFAYFGPDSFARTGRTSWCRRGSMGSRIQVRLQEADYALQRVEKIDWIDQNRIVLSGFSEGAQAASAYSGRRFAAIVLLGTDCRAVGGSPRAPKDIPVINIVGSNDDYGYGGGCAGKLSRKLAIANGSHDVSLEEEARQALAEFLSGIKR